MLRIYTETPSPLLLLDYERKLKISSVASMVWETPRIYSFLLGYQRIFKLFSAAAGFQRNSQHFRVIPKAVTRLPPTVAALVRTQVSSYGICGAQNCTGTVLLRYFGFPCQSIVPSAPRSSSSIIIRDCYNGQNSGQRGKWT
jgi:hypothetical protein